MTGYIVFAHGSSVASANETVKVIANKMAAAGSYGIVEPAFLEMAHPDLGEAVSKAIERGARRIVVIPYFLTLGIHLQRDLPRIVDGLASIHPGIEIEVKPPLDGHPALLTALLDRAAEQ